MRWSIVAAMAVCWFVGHTPNGRCAPPGSIPIQGRLTDNTGAPLPAGDKGFEFRIFDAEFNGTQIWPSGVAEAQILSTDANGLWTANVGAVIPISDSVFSDSVRWIEIGVSDLVSSTVFLPRVRLLTGPYAFGAGRVGSIDGASGGSISSKVTIGPGNSNTGANAFVAGADNVASGDWATVPGGRFNHAAGDYSFAGGRRARGNHAGTFVWGDATDADFLSTGPNQFLIRASGGVGIGTASPIGMLHVSSGIRTSGYFTSNFQDPETKVLRGVYLGAPADARAVYGESALFDYWGIGGEFVGGFIGAQGVVNATGSNSYYGIRGFVIGGNGTVYGATGIASGGGTNYGVYGQASGGTANYAGYFDGDVHVIGSITNSSATVQIDHPLDPENKYLNQATVESPEMMTVYNGNAVCDANGRAVVALPDYIEALNRDFRYQLTCVGGFAPVYVAEKIAGNRFAIAGGTPGLEVSWQVTGVRQDAYAEANRVPVEQDKSVAERGLYLNPEAFGQPVSRGINHRRVQSTREISKSATEE